MPGILIIAPNWIGDAVMTQPLLASIKGLYPDSTIDVLASTWVAPIYRACSEVNEVIEAKFEHKQLQWSLRKQLAKQIEKQKYQACFVLPNSFKSALIPWLANIPLRIAYRGEMRFGLINIALDNPSKINRPPMVQHYLALSALLNDEEQAESRQVYSDTPPPRLNVSTSAKQSIQSKLQSANITDSIYVFCPGAEYGPSKRWPTEHFATLAQDLIKANPNNHIILIGSQGDLNLANEISPQGNQNSNIHNWCGSTSLDEAIALIGMSKAVVSNDSGLMHIAAALRAPQVAVFGSSDPAHTPPLSDRAKVIWLDLPCSPCHKRECPLGHLKCLKDILPQQVLATLNTLQ
ncbi:lipopolysaccharide heptosyltransferase II [Polynucleobacter sp. AP-Melu-500A-A1]|uniref:lipopolysaccharide heptosyltransferase II n=1 Tax=Polynucleobacter sp. AP-Melu-500A-A1 TaxID=2576929 RepID=UPI001C0B270E|nr:lipopolysaccharide heptosyltransferase II [Polynucleobacter sp. AP-Melu-500A-A1]MBU3631640.1 lipopolysaccharide heptosyltransferase II [Polynucleobacter sp. AP-Melu-500A-A1]